MQLGSFLRVLVGILDHLDEVLHLVLDLIYTLHIIQPLLDVTSLLHFKLVLVAHVLTRVLDQPSEHGHCDVSKDDATQKVREPLDEDGKEASFLPTRVRVLVPQLLCHDFHVLDVPLGIGILTLDLLQRLIVLRESIVSLVLGIDPDDGLVLLVPVQLAEVLVSRDQVVLRTLVKLDLLLHQRLLHTPAIIQLDEALTERPKHYHARETHKWLGSSKL